MKRLSQIFVGGFGCLILAGCAAPLSGETAPVAAAAAMPAATAATAGQTQIDDLLARMTTERKVAQLIMPDISAITPEDVQTYRFGSILNGGNSGPGGNDLAQAPEWLALADAYWAASTAPLPNGEPAIPALWATDAVHGHSNVPGATIFPHNIGLGATRDTALMEEIGRVTAAEIAVTGIDWTFAPTLAVATDDRWGRTYESFSENGDLVAELGAATIKGLQGAVGSAEFLDQTRVLATAKHFYGDGGTAGKDRGDTAGSQSDLARVHLSPYPPAFAAGAPTVMASFSSVNGEKVHGSKALLTDLLRGDLGFDGLVVGDWNGHGELAACSNTNCPESLLAGLDIYMVPEDWRGLYDNLLAQVGDGTIPMARLDEAVRRILTVKQQYGVFDKPAPSARSLAGQWDMLGSAEHRDVARAAVRQSLVLLKNDGILPLRSSANVLVAGSGADDIAQQSGGWSLTWQGGGELTNANFPGATSVFAGIAEAMAAGGGQATLSVDGSYSAKPDAAIVIFGEQPYAEFVGDREDLAFRDEEGLELLREFAEQDIPAVAVFLSGRPMWMNREIAAADAFVAAWLPGSEGAGIADLIIGDAAGAPRSDFTGKLSFGWPEACAPGSPLLYQFGDGGSYAAPPVTASLSTDCALLTRDFSGGLSLFERGLNQTVVARAADGEGAATLANLSGSSPSGALQVAAFDYRAQEDARRIKWSAPADLAFGWGAQTMPADGAVRISYKVDVRPEGDIALGLVCDDCNEGYEAGASVDLKSTLTLAAGKGWRTAEIPLRCLGVQEGSDAATGLALKSGAAFVFELETIGIVAQATQQDCNGPF